MRYQLLLSTDILSSVVCVYLFVRPKLQEKAKNIQPLPRHTKNDEKNQIPAGAHKKTQKSDILGRNFIPEGVPNYIF